MARKSAEAPAPTPAQLAAAALGRLGGKANTDKQRAARQANSKFAGRPRRVCLDCGEPVVGGHVNRALDTSCGAHGWRWQQGSKPRTDPPLVRVAIPPEFANLVLAALRAARAPGSVIRDLRAALDRVEHR